MDAQPAKNPFEDETDEEPVHTDPLLDKKESEENAADGPSKNKKSKKKSPKVLKGLKKRLSGKKSKSKADDTDEPEKENVSTMAESTPEPAKTEEKPAEVHKVVQKPYEEREVDVRPKEELVVTKRVSTNPFVDSDEESDDEETPLAKKESPAPKVEVRPGLKNLLNLTENIRKGAETLDENVKETYPESEKKKQPEADQKPQRQQAEEPKQKEVSLRPPQTQQTQSLPADVTKTRPKSESTQEKGKEKEKGHLSRTQKLRKSLPWRFKMKKKRKNKDEMDGATEMVDKTEAGKSPFDEDESEEEEEKHVESSPMDKRTQNLGGLVATTEGIREKLEQTAETVKSTEEPKKKPEAHTWPERTKPSDSFDVVDEGTPTGKASTSKSRKVLKSLSWRLKGKKKSDNHETVVEEAAHIVKEKEPTGETVTKVSYAHQETYQETRSEPPPAATSYPESRSVTADDVRKVKAQVEGVKDTVHDNIKLLEERDHRLESLENLAENVQETSTMFRKISKKTHRKMLWRNRRWRIIICIGAVAAVVIIIIIIIVATLPSGEDNGNTQPQTVVTVKPLENAPTSSS